MSSQRKSRSLDLDLNVKDFLQFLHVTFKTIATGITIPMNAIILTQSLRLLSIEEDQDIF